MGLTTIPPLSHESSPLSERPHSLVHLFGEEPLRTDGELLALGHAADGTVWSVEEPGILRHWDLSKPTQLEAFPLDDLATVWAFSPDCRLVAAGSDDLTIWCVNTGKVQATFTTPGWIMAIAFSNDLQFAATGHEDGSIYLWDINEHQSLLQIEKAHQSAISALSFSPDGAIIASAGEDKCIRLCETRTGTIHDTMMCHNDRIPALLWHPTMPRLISAGWDTTARIWDVTTAEPIMLLNSHAAQVHQLAISRDGQHLVCADSAQDLHLWDLETFKTLHVWEKQGSEIQSLSFSPDGQQIVSGGIDRSIRVYDLKDSSVSNSPSELLASRSAIAVNSEKNLLMGCAPGVGLKLWNLTSREPKQLPIDSEQARAAALSPDGNTLAVSLVEEIDTHIQKSSTSSLWLWDPLTGKPSAELQGQQAPITALAYSADGALLASGSFTSSDIWLWNVKEAKPHLLIPDALIGHSIEALAFNPTNNQLILSGIDWLSTSGTNGAVSIWDIEQMKEVQRLNGGSVALAVHPQGELLAAATLGRTVELWNLNTGELQHELESHADALTCVAFSSDGKMLVTGSDDFTLHLWDVEKIELQAAVRMDTQVKAIVFSNDGQFLFTSNGNSSCYQLSVEQMLKSDA